MRSVMRYIMHYVMHYVMHFVMRYVMQYVMHLCEHREVARVARHHHPAASEAQVEEQLRRSFAQQPADAPLVGPDCLAAALAEDDQEVDEAREPRLLPQQADETLDGLVVHL